LDPILYKDFDAQGFDLGQVSLLVGAKDDSGDFMDESI